MTAMGGDDFARVQEIVAHGNGLVEQPARVVAQVENIAMDLPWAWLLQVVDGVTDMRIGIFIEAVEPDIADRAGRRGDRSGLSRPGF